MSCPAGTGAVQIVDLQVLLTTLVMREVNVSPAEVGAVKVPVLSAAIVLTVMISPADGVKLGVVEPASVEVAEL
jgi:hypothetical protein